MPRRRPRRLLLVSAGLAQDGGGTAVVGRLALAVLREYCAERGFELRALDLGRGGAPLPEIPVRHFGGRRWSLARAVWRAQLEPAQVAALVFDHLGPSRCQSALPRPLRRPHLVFLNGIEVWRPLSWDQQRALRLARVRLAISEHTRRRAREFSPWLPPVEVLPLALEERPAWGTADAATLARCGRDFILMVGRMAAAERYKGHDQMLEALARLSGARLVVAGDGDDRPRLEARAEALGLADRVVFTRFVDEATLHRLYEACAVFVMPSRDEGFGLAYLEAMRASKPCVAARGCAAEEIVIHGETGALVRYGDVEGLAGALAGLLGDRGQAARWGLAGRRRWEQRFGYDAFRAGLVPHLDRLTASPGDVRH